MIKAARMFLPLIDSRVCENDSSKGNDKGFTLIELFVTIAILSILIAISTPYLFGFKEKASLELQGEIIVNTLRDAQQKAISAYKGYDYGVSFSQNGYILESVHEGERTSLTSTQLPEKIVLSEGVPSAITFLKLTGKADSALELTLASTRFQCQITVNQEGTISSTLPERK